MDMYAAAKSFLLGPVMNQNPTLRLGNCNYADDVPKLVEPIRIDVVRGAWIRCPPSRVVAVGLERAFYR